MNNLKWRMKNREELLNTIKNVLERYDEIEFAFLFGSVARKEENPLSDVDIAIYQKKKSSVYDYLIYELEVEAKLIETLPDEKFDVRSLNTAPIVAVGKIINEGEPIFVRNKSLLNEFIELQRVKYMDYLLVYEPFLEQRFQALLND